MKLLSKKFLMPIFATVMGVSFVAADAVAMDQDQIEKLLMDLDKKVNGKFSGRASGYYWSGSSKENDDADTISNTRFINEGRFGVTASATEGEWTGSAKLEFDADAITNRDMWAQLANKQFSVRVGRHYFGEFCGGKYLSFSSSNDCVGDMIGRTEGVQVALKGIPNISAAFSYQDVDNGAADVTGFRPSVTYKANNLVISASYESQTSTENDDRGGDEDNTSTSTRLSIYGDIAFGNIDVFAGYDMDNMTMEEAQEGGSTVDTDTSGNNILLGANVGLGNKMGITAMFLSETMVPDDDTDLDDEVTTEMSLSFMKHLAGVQIKAGYVTSSTTADEDSGVDGATSSALDAGLRFNF